MAVSRDSPLIRLLLLSIIFSTVSLRALALNSVCEFSLVDRKKLYTFDLASPLPNFPHGVLSEDGFYKVEANETVLWFQLCDGMVFNHDPPKCVDCLGCGGPSRCGMDCSALVSTKEGGYPVCTTIGHASGITINVIDKKHPHTGVIVRMSTVGKEYNCSLTVSVICDETGVQAPRSLEKNGGCHYATVLKHPSGCADIANIHGKGWGWFSTFLLIVLCLFGAYLLAGTIYRHFYLGIRGIDVIPNLEFWSSLPQRAQLFFITGAEISGTFSRLSELIFFCQFLSAHMLIVGDIIAVSFFSLVKILITKPEVSARFQQRSTKTSEA